MKREYITIKSIKGSLHEYEGLALGTILITLQNKSFRYIITLLTYESDYFPVTQILNMVILYSKLPQGNILYDDISYKFISITSKHLISLLNIPANVEADCWRDWSIPREAPYLLATVFNGISWTSSWRARAVKNLWCTASCFAWRRTYLRSKKI